MPALLDIINTVVSAVRSGVKADSNRPLSIPQLIIN